MGVVISYFGGYGRANETDPVTGLTTKEKFLVTSTFALVKKDMCGVGAELFLMFFEDFPHYQKYFPFRDVPFAELKDNKSLQAHACNVMYALSAIVDNLDETGILLQLLEKTAISHGRKPIPEQSFWDLKQAILKTLEKKLGTKLSTEAKGAWDKTITVAFNVMMNVFKEEKNKNAQ